MTMPNNPCNNLVAKEFPELKRLNYCHGQMLGAQDFVDEQSYFLNKIALLTRSLQGFGTVCGLVVESNPLCQALSDSQVDAPEGGYVLRISPGVAVDSCGRELVHRLPERNLAIRYSDSAMPGCEDLLWYSNEDFDKFQRSKTNSEHSSVEPFDVWLTVQYDAQLAGHQELPRGGCCESEVRSIKNRWGENPCFALTFSKPPEQSCSSCCDPTDESRLWLAKLTFLPGKHPLLLAIDNTVRRHITTYENTRISGVNWLHTGVYEEGIAEPLLTNGLTITFSAPIDVQSLKNHEVRLEDGEPQNDLVEVALSDELDVHKHNPLQILQVQVLPMPSDDGLVRKIKVLARSKRLSPPLRVLITVRTEFLLDKCCQPIDGSNRGGFTDFVGWDHSDVSYPEEKLFRTVKEFEERFKPPQSCRCCQKCREEGKDDCEHVNTLPNFTGNNVPGSNFQSWFYVVGNECMSKYSQNNL